MGNPSCNSVLIFILFTKDKKIVVIVVVPVDMWISIPNEGKTAYQHVDRLCVKTKKLYTLFLMVF